MTRGGEKRGQTEGRKDRSCAIALAVDDRDPKADARKQVAVARSQSLTARSATPMPVMAWPRSPSATQAGRINACESRSRYRDAR
jgi:hypothetical protein